jgi:hypothetical protein
MTGWLRALVLTVVVLAVGVLAGSAISQWRERGASGAPAAAPRHAGGRVRVEVLNGGGHAGVARHATTRLRDLGFDVVFFGNASAFGRDTSVVLDRVGAIEPARAVADALGIRNVRSEPDSNLYLDVSVVLGVDWLPAAADTARATRPPERAWWDPRGWLRN